MESKLHIQTSDLNETDVVVSHGEALLSALLRKGVDINHSCGGNGTCGTCRIFVNSGLENFLESNDLEIEMINDRSFLAQERLACQSQLRGSASIRIPKN